MDKISQSLRVLPRRVAQSRYKLIMLIALVSGMATFGSLYYSFHGDIVQNIKDGVLFPGAGGFEPCNLCWYSRTLMYPTFIISVVALFKRFAGIVDYVLPLSFLGVILSTYHYYIQKFPNNAITTCSANVPCTALQVNYLGFITIPLLALCAYIIIFVVCLIQKSRNEQKA